MRITRGHSGKQRGHSRSSRNSIPTEVGGHHPATAGPSSSSGGKPSRTVQFRHPIIQAATGASSTGHGGPNLFEDDPGIMSEAETSSTPGRRRQLLRSNSGGGGGPGGPGGLKASYKNREFIQNSQKHALPVVRTPSKTLERPLGLVFLVYRYGYGRNIFLEIFFPEIEVIKKLSPFALVSHSTRLAQGWAYLRRFQNHRELSFLWQKRSPSNFEKM